MPWNIAISEGMAVGLTAFKHGCGGNSDGEDFWVHIHPYTCASFFLLFEIYESFCNWLG
jgi:hypothetical protein